MGAENKNLQDEEKEKKENDMGDRVEKNRPYLYGFFKIQLLEISKKSCLKKRPI